MRNFKKFAALTLCAAVMFFFLPGCKKELYSPTPKDSASNHRVSTLSNLSLSAGDTAMVITPFGLRRKADVHLIPEGHSLKYSGDHLVEIETATGKMINDFGVQSPLPYLLKKPVQNAALKQNNFNGSKGSTSSIPPAVIDTNWKTWAQGTRTKQGVFANLPFPQTFTTSWTVPSLPTTLNDGQIIFIFDGLQDSNFSEIMQPVLQYGYNGLTGSATSWSIANYYASCSQCAASYSTSIPVSPGDALVGQIQQTGQSGSNTWTSSFFKNGQMVTSLTPPPLTVTLTTLFESIEAVHVTKASDYPPDNFVQMDPNAGNPVMDFVANTGSTARLGEHTVLPGTTNMVDLYFHPLPAPIISYTTPDVYTANTAISPLNPTNTGGAVVSYSVSPALPAGLTLNTTSGVISGTPGTVSTATNYTVTATNSAGSGHTTVNITVNNYTINVVSNAPNPTYFELLINGTPLNSTVYMTRQGIVFPVSGNCNRVSNSTVVMQLKGGYVPVGAALYGYGAPIYGVISGSNITFSGVNLTLPFGGGTELVIN